MTETQAMPSVADVLAIVDTQPTAAAYTRAARELVADRTDLEPVRVSLLASFTVAPLVPYLTVEAARRGFAVNAYVGPFNSAIPELVSPASGNLAHEPDVVFVAQLLEDVCPAIAHRFLSLTPEDVRAQIGQAVADLHAGVTAFRQHSAAAVVLHNFALPVHAALGIVDGVTRGSQTEAIRALNTQLAEVASSLAGVYVLDYERLVGETGARAWWDDKMWALGRAPLSAQALPALAHRQATFIRALRSPARKCLVVDLDDTLWGGVLGELGPAGIKLGADYPGNVFRDLQRTLLQLKERGVLLAINSKNNLDDVRDAFLTNPDMVLSLDDFSAIRANWEAKPANMIAIARELNIGLDSLVFIDDNPAERALMRQALPDVMTLDLPQNPLKYAPVLQESGAFDRLNLTREDATRTDMYRAQQQRREFEQSALTMDDFLISLEMHVTVDPVNAASLTRVVDLLHKTNQFNLTTRRHPAAEVSGMMTDPAYGVFTVRVTDRFGDNGIVGVAIVHEQTGAAHIDSLLLSCRVIGRTIETALLWQVAEWARARGVAEIHGEFVPTAKNAPAADFFTRHGFEPLPTDTPVSRWRLDLRHADIAWPSFLAAAT